MPGTDRPGGSPGPRRGARRGEWVRVEAAQHGRGDGLADDLRGRLRSIADGGGGPVMRQRQVYHRPGL